MTKLGQLAIVILVLAVFAGSSDQFTYNGAYSKQEANIICQETHAAISLKIKMCFSPCDGASECLMHNLFKQGWPKRKTLRDIMGAWVSPHKLISDGLQEEMVDILEQNCFPKIPARPHRDNPVTRCDSFKPIIECLNSTAAIANCAAFFGY